MFSSRVANLNPYVPGEQPKDRVYIKLNANENPYPPSSKVIKAVTDFISTHPEKMGLYPDPDSTELRKAIAEHLNQTGGCMNCTKKLQHDITPDMIICGNGSDEVLSLVFYTFFDSSKPLVAPNFTYSFYPVYCGFYKIPLYTVPIKTDFTLDTDAMLLKARENSTGLIFANPNAPTSLSLSVGEVRKMLENYPSDMPFVVDEAYVDFGTESCLELLSDFENLVIVRTFSKSMSGAGMRLGYCVANPTLIKTLETAKNSFNHFPIDAITQVAGIASCLDTDYYIANTKKIVKTRDDFCAFLKNHGWNFYESKTNFVLASHPYMKGQDVYKKIKESGILVRHFSTEGIENFVRITIGTENQMQSLMNAIENLG